MSVIAGVPSVGAVAAGLAAGSQADVKFPNLPRDAIWYSTQAKVVLAIGLLLATGQARWVAAADTAPEPGHAVPRFALLVGVQKYAHLAPHEQLAGCENDTQLVRRLLAERYGFRDADIVIRTNEAATGDAIRAEFSQLVQRVRSLPAEAGTAQVVFHFSGHGSQIPDQPEGHPNCDEQDGLDETLVPYDATKQGGPEDVRDDELYEFVDQLCAGGKARVWVILDCCHSGTGARGATRFRSLERGSVLPLAPEQQRARRVTSKRLPDGAVLLAAPTKRNRSTKRRSRATAC